MSYEINLIAINQDFPVYLKHTNRVLLHNEIDNNDVNRYDEIWPLFSNTKGILYSLVEELNEDFYSAFKLCDSDFESEVPENILPNWVSANARENITPFIISNDVYVEVIDIIQYVLECAPLKKILFHTRYQGGEEEIIVGVIKMSKFKDMLIQKQILFNMCYILESD